MQELESKMHNALDISLLKLRAEIEKEQVPMKQALKDLGATLV